MQKYKFVESVHGVSKAGRAYNFAKLSDGLATFTVSNAKGLDLSAFKKGQDVNVEFEVTAGYKGDAVVSIGKVS